MNFKDIFFFTFLLIILIFILLIVSSFTENKLEKINYDFFNSFGSCGVIIDTYFTNILNDKRYHYHNACVIENDKGERLILNNEKNAERGDYWKLKISENKLSIVLDEEIDSCYEY